MIKKLKHILHILRSDYYLIVSENNKPKMPKQYAISLVFVKRQEGYATIKNGLRVVTARTQSEAIDFAYEDCIKSPYFEGMELNQYTSTVINY